MNLDVQTIDLRYDVKLESSLLIPFKIDFQELLQFFGSSAIRDLGLLKRRKQFGRRSCVIVNPLVDICMFLNISGYIRFHIFIQEIFEPEPKENSIGIRSYKFCHAKSRTS